MEMMMRKEKVVRLFGVKIHADDYDDEEELEDEVIRKSRSMGNLVSCDHHHSSSNNREHEEGYTSESGLFQSSSRKRKAHEIRKRGIPWTEDEHRTFLAGLEKLGKGDWRGISKNFVTTRTPTQVASHAQKYFLRQNNAGKKKRRSSLFDVVINNKVSANESATNLSPNKSKEIQQEKTHISHDNYLETSSSPSSVITRIPVASQEPKVARNQNFTSFQVPNLRVAIPSSIVKDQRITTLSMSPSLGVNAGTCTIFQPNNVCSPDFLRLSLTYPNCENQYYSASPSVETNDLELRIAPPQTHNLSSSSPQGPSDAIRVI